MVHLSDRDSAQKSMNLILNKKGVMGYFILVAPGQVAEWLNKSQFSLCRFFFIFIFLLVCKYALSGQMSQLTRGLSLLLVVAVGIMTT